MFKLTKLTALYLKGLGIFRSTVDSLSPQRLRDLHWKALRRLEQEVGMRRRLEHDSSQEIQLTLPTRAASIGLMGHNQGGAWCAQ